MPRKEQPRGALRRAASSIARLLGRGNGRGRDAAPHHPRREPDIPLDEIEQAYTPTQTSLKGPFRASGAERQRDQEYAAGFGDGRWNDEDRLTNKSGDPRIGTHGRTYEPGEDR